MPEDLCKFVTRGLRMFALLSMKERQIKKMCHPKHRLKSISNLVKGIILGSLSNDGGDGNENGKIVIGLTLHVHHAFLYISLPSLHD